MKSRACIIFLKIKKLIQTQNIIFILSIYRYYYYFCVSQIILLFYVCENKVQERVHLKTMKNYRISPVIKGNAKFSTKRELIVCPSIRPDSVKLMKNQ